MAHYKYLMAHYNIFCATRSSDSRREREWMIDLDTKMPIVESCDVSMLSRSSAHYPSRSLPGADLAQGRGLSGAAPCPAGKPSPSSLLVADEIRPNQPGPPLS